MFRAVITLKGDPRTKKNSQRIYTRRDGKPFVAPSGAFRAYSSACTIQISPQLRGRFEGRYNVKCVYFMKTRRRVDLNNLLEATTDILVHANVLADDNANIVAGHDGSRVRYDPNNPRVEIVISELID